MQDGPNPVFTPEFWMIMICYRTPDGKRKGGKDGYGLSETLSRSLSVNAMPREVLMAGV